MELSPYFFPAILTAIFASGYALISGWLFVDRMSRNVNGTTEPLFVLPKTAYFDSVRSRAFAVGIVVFLFDITKGGFAAGAFNEAMLGPKSYEVAVDSLAALVLQCLLLAVFGGLACLATQWISERRAHRRKYTT
jgi:hypothetical protein